LDDHDADLRPVEETIAFDSTRRARLLRKSEIVRLKIAEIPVASTVPSPETPVAFFLNTLPFQHIGHMDRLRTPDETPRFAFAITGASGTPIAIRLLQSLLLAGCEVHLTVSASGAAVLQQELGLEVQTRAFDWRQLQGRVGSQPMPRADWLDELLSPFMSLDFSQATYHLCDDFSAGIASGSFRTSGMVICPCSMGTLAAVAHGMSTNLIQRAADVHLKERRPLIVVPRETPLSLVHIENMRRLTEAGAIVLPAMPAWYHHPRGVLDLIDSVVQRICDHLGVEVTLAQRWGESGSQPGAG
jgi:4-hydroxy-3-polyprenylbenzoate decarboxylase